ncbi:MAG: hypothetical protein ACI9EW_000739 [Cellvibrionaceae bacterium]|jgi:hypothetical protein
MSKELLRFKSFIQRTPQIFIFILVLIASRIAAASMLHVFDDAFITFRYAQNLANGIGFVYNPGEWVLGTTAPAYGLLVSIFELLRLPTPLAVTAMNILIDVGLFLFAVRLWPKDTTANDIHRRFFILIL